MTEPLPYRIAVLCYLYDIQGRLLLLHRHRTPNQHLYSPVGGKLEQDIGESPMACAIREIEEETSLRVEPGDLHLTGLVTEAGFDDAMHWMMFLYEVTHPVQIEAGPIDEGMLQWHEIDKVGQLPIPRTDQRVIWPLYQRYRGQFFCAHLNCSGGEIRWRIEQPACDVTDWSDRSMEAKP